MHPVLLDLGPLQLRAYGLALSVSFLVGSWLALKRGRARGMSEDMLLGLFWWIIIASIVGSRLHYVLAHPDQFTSPLQAFQIWGGGLILYGGLIAATLVSWLYVRRKRMAFLPVADVVAPSLALGEAITRIGCFFNGCCFGDRCSGALCVHYPADSYSSHVFGAGVGVWPSQLFLSAALLVGFFVLLRVESRLRAAGGMLGLYLLIQGIARYAIDFTRYYSPGDQLDAAGDWLVARSQLTALLLSAFGALLLVRAWKARGAAAPIRRGARR